MKVVSKLKGLMHFSLRMLGYQLVPYRPQTPPPPSYPVDFSATDQKLVSEVKPYTMTSPERIFALVRAVEYVHKHSIPGSIVECGVWKGGSMLAVAKTFKALNDQSRDLYLFDTFEGMTAPTEHDRSFDDDRAARQLANSDRQDSASVWCFADLESVKRTLALSGYDPARLHFVRGPVEETIPAQAPDQIALLRLDTDWYESTRHEFEHLFPRLAPGGVLIIDDYGHWKGSRQATDEYLEKHGVRMLLNRIDYTGRIGIKLE